MKCNSAILMVGVLLGLGSNLGRADTGQPEDCGNGGAGGPIIGNGAPGGDGGSGGNGEDGGGGGANGGRGGRSLREDREDVLAPYGWVFESVLPRVASDEADPISVGSPPWKRIASFVS